jgi:stage V sporulation protein R
VASLPSNLRRLKNEIRASAVEFGLDFFETFFELLPADEVNEIAAFGGFPTRYPHWRFGMQYDPLAKGYGHGLSRIYELVINNDPCYAYLMSGNEHVVQKIVIAHVFAHADFFKNNMEFSKTNRKMMDEMANHGAKVRRYIDRHGLERVETFLDACLSIEDLIDIHSPFITRERNHDEAKENWEEGRPTKEVGKIRSRDYMEQYINPPDLVEAKRKEIAEKADAPPPFPPEPVRDILKFLLEHAPLRKWEQDILDMIREEAYYFAPQGMTKIMNEGWASYWHSKIMTERALTDAEVVDYADYNSKVLGGGGQTLNPYKLGVELYRDIEDRWNRGRHGLDFDRCDDAAIVRDWDLGLGEGRDKIFQVRRVYNDVTFLDTFLTEEFCHEQKLFLYKFNPGTGKREIVNRDFPEIKRQLLYQITNRGQPRIDVVNGNHGNRGELYLLHHWDGMDLKLDHATDTLQAIHRIWNRPVHLETRIEGQGMLLSFDGEKSSMADMTPSAE